MQEVIMIMGPMASGKSSQAKQYVDQGYVYLNRDSMAGNKNHGTYDTLQAPMREALATGKSVVLDNTHVSVEKRKPFIQLAKDAGVPIRCVWMQTSIEDSQINALIRMMERYGRVFRTPEECKEADDPNVFPVTVLFRYRKQFEKPTVEEGFEDITKVPFVRKWPDDYTNKGLLVDYDGTLRTVKDGEYFYPIGPEQVSVTPGRSEVLKKYKKDGYILVGISNQSGIAPNNKYGGSQLSERDAISCFEFTNRELGVDIDYYFCPHCTPPTCYCRKPQSGMGVQAIVTHKLDPSKCIMVGDRTTDKTFATRLGIKYFDAEDFFNADGSK
jgi:histidinol-phosphate phosphatase family protein